MKTVITALCSILALACATAREVPKSAIANPLVVAEYHEGGMIIGTPTDPLAVANWRLSIASDGQVEQELFDEKAGKWRLFRGSALSTAEVASVLSACEALPVTNLPGEAVILGRLATDTTYLHLTLRAGTTSREVYAYAPIGSDQVSRQFLGAWRRVAGHRPVRQSPGG